MSERDWRIVAATGVSLLEVFVLLYPFFVPKLPEEPEPMWFLVWAFPTVVLFAIGLISTPFMVWKWALRP